MPLLDDQLLFVLLHALDIGHDAEPLHIKSEVERVLWLPVCALSGLLSGRSFSGRRPPYLQFRLLFLLLFFSDHCLDEI